MGQTNTDLLWSEYLSTKSPDVKRRLVLEYSGIVKFVVSKFRSFSKQSVSVIDEQDLMQLGMIGLLDSIERFDPSRGVKFETYAITRVRGTVQDELRKLDWVPRSIREKVRKIDRATQKIECGDILTNSATRVAADLSMTLEDYLTMLHETQTASPEANRRGTESDDALENLADEEPSAVDRMADEQLKQLLVRFVENLPQQDRLVISLYYYEELTFKEIANVLRLSESRVFQKHQAILERIRADVEELV